MTIPIKADAHVACLNCSHIRAAFGLHREPSTGVYYLLCRECSDSLAVTRVGTVPRDRERPYRWL